MMKYTLLLALLTLALAQAPALAQVSTFPYVQDFETTNDWVSSGVLDSWAFGTPAKPVINSAASGVNCWMTGGLAGLYPNSEQSQILGPTFDFTSLPFPSITVSVWWECEFSWDGAVLQSSIDGGMSWQNVGMFGDPGNWYTDSSIFGLAWTGLQEGWTGRTTSSNGSGAWVTASHDLTGLGGQSSVLLRFAFGSDGSVQSEGVAFDDIAIFDNPPPALDVGVVSIDSPGDPNVSGVNTVTVTIENFGSMTQTSIPVSYDVDMGTPVNETYVGSIAPGATDTYSFTAQANLAAGAHTITAYTALPGDGNPANDGASVTVNTFDYPYPGTPMGDLELGTGVNAAPTSGFGNYTKTATALDTINLGMVSPMGTYDYQPFVLLAQPFTTGTPPAPTIPGLVWIDLGQPFVILIDIDPFLTQFLNPGGTPYSFVLPAGFVGQSFLFQGACVTPALSLTDGYEIQVL